MFGANKVSNVVENAIKSNNNVNLEEAQNAKISLVSFLIVLAIFLLLTLVLGPYIWNHTVKKLVPSVGKARWYDILLLAVLMGLVVPA